MNSLLTVTDVVEYAFCPKFTYFSKILGLPQYEEKRGTVMTGRNIHTKHEKSNTNYIPKHFEGKKLIAIQFYSRKFQFTGKIDEAIETENELIIIERKYSDRIVIGPTIKVQIGLLAILLEENLGKPVTKAFVIFSKNKREEVFLKVDEQIKNYAIEQLEEVRRILNSGMEPQSEFDSRCLNCCYRKICQVGSLNTQ